MHIWWKYRLVVLIYGHCGIGPPQKCLWQGGSVIQLALYFEVGFIRIKSETGHSLGVKHLLDFIHPNGFTSITVFLDGKINGIECRGPVVLRPVKFDAAGNPWASQT